MMKTFLFKSFLVCLFSLTSMIAFAYNCEIDGIYYNLYTTDNTATVTYKTTAYNSYSGVINIPDEIEYNGIVYTVTSIGYSAFGNCSDLTRVTMSNNITLIGSYAFSGCSNLIEITIPTSVTSISESTFEDCSSLTNVIIPNSVAFIGKSAFSGCTGLTEITIGNSIRSVGSLAFKDCSSLKKVHINDLSAWCNIWFSGGESNPLAYAHHLYLDDDEVIKLLLPTTITKINAYSFYGCEGLTELTIPNNVTNIDYKAFYGCNTLSEIIIPNSVTYLGDSSFENCNNLKEAIIGDNIMEITESAFRGCPDLAVRVKRGTMSLLSLWNAGFEPYDVETAVKLTCPRLTKVSTTQTSITMGAEYLYDEYEFYINGEKTYGEDVTVLDLFPETPTPLFLDIYIDGTFGTRVFYQEITTAPISPTINTTSFPSSIHAIGSHIEGDAKTTTSMRIYKGRSTSSLVMQTEGRVLSLVGLDPNEQYTVIYDVTVTNSKGDYKTYSQTEIVSTTELILKTSKNPKVISIGNVIVAAESNLDDEETNVGFEWRRTDWTDDFASNIGAAYLYEGMMEGYIRNLNTDKLWKYRPYYLSNSGTYYYGDWVGLDPTNTSYFEPTVHTYATVNVEGNIALVKGYALTGTDGVVVQGFKYWKSVAGIQNANVGNRAISVPSNAMTVEAGGQVMTANLTGLDYSSTYHYTAFITTSTGETFYGEEQIFCTDEDPTGINGVMMEKSDVINTVRQGVYTLMGVKVAEDISGLFYLPKGIYIVNGKKYVVK